MTTFVYRSTDTGAPAAITGATSGVTLAAVLRGCLINGYNTQTGVTSTQTSGTATFTKTAHGYNVGQVLTITGFTTTGYNLTKGVVLTVPSSSTWTMTVAGGTASPGVGTGSVIVAAADWSGSPWTEPYSAAGGIALFKAPVTGSTSFCYRFDENTAAINAQFRGYEAMTGLSTGNTNPFPTLAQIALGSGPYIAKSTTNDGTARPWEVFTNGKLVHLFIKNNVATVANRSLYIFGDVQTNKSGDAYNAYVSGEVAAGTPLFGITINSTVASSGAWATRKSDQTGTAITISRSSADTSACNSTTAPGTGGMSYPNTADGGLYFTPLNLYEATTPSVFRGSLPGLWNPCHNLAGVVATNDTVTGSGPLSGKTFEFFVINYANSSTGIVAIETSDTWNV